MQELFELLKDYPKIKQAVELRWHTISCKEYIDSLLADTRGGTRQGFPLHIVEALLAIDTLNTEYLEDNGMYFPDFEESQFADTTWKLPKNF